MSRSQSQHSAVSQDAREHNGDAPAVPRPAPFRSTSQTSLSSVDRRVEKRQTLRQLDVLPRRRESVAVAPPTHQKPRARLGEGLKEVNATVLLVNLGDFEQYLQKGPGAQVTNVLCMFLSLMEEVAREGKGTLQWVHGDRILVSFGASSRQSAHCLRACQAAVAVAEHRHEDPQVLSAAGQAHQGGLRPGAARQAAGLPHRHRQLHGARRATRVRVLTDRRGDHRRG
eukprot:NODE_320_length_1634_cov_102.612618_g241_i0.p2 GENE.NODE_320_length_1634_cov_102.612618_g241_i0~~NODE_320_length_1634_cov_102.612618_g241_i0.p2  ORF type:complete len:227 (+),score=55.70 NODE_320_length_1634_cov_102.612618_g241_i0:265-945(+)